MKYVVAEHCGFCYGVIRAVKIAQTVVKGYNNSVATLGELIHNPLVVDKLRRLGVDCRYSLADFKAGDTVVIRSHGVGPDVYAEAQARGLELCDATCPHVQKAQKMARILSEEGRTVIIIGEHKHPEVESIKKWAGASAYILQEIVENQRLEAVISMPSGVFKPYAGVSTAILIFTKTEHGGTDNVWFYDMQADGFSLDDKRSPIADNDIPDIIERFRNRDAELDRKRTDKSFMVPKQDIVDNAYDLSINKYKEVEYVPVEYPPTSEIMANIREIEIEIGNEMEELARLLGE